MIGYDITNEGQVISYKQDKVNGKYLKLGINARGYYHVMVNGITTTIHRLVAWKYVSGYKEGFTVNHIDGNKKNNHYTNLEWVSLKNNAIRKLFTDQEIRGIREKYTLWKNNKDRRYTSYRLAEKYGVSVVTIMNIVRE